MDSKFDQLYNKIITQQSVIQEGWLGKLATGTALAASLVAGAHAAPKTTQPPKQPPATTQVQTKQYVAKADSRHQGKEYTLDLAKKVIINFEKTKKDKDGNHIKYKDVKGVDTIGYGCTDKTLVKKGKITEEEAQKALTDEVIKVYDHLKKKFGKDWDVMDDFMQAGLISLYYNVGMYSNFSKLEAAVKAHNWKEAAKQFLDIDNITVKDPKTGKEVKQKCSGLTIRRAKEAQNIFLFWVKYDQNVAKMKAKKK